MNDKYARFSKEQTATLRSYLSTFNDRRNVPASTKLLRSTAREVKIIQSPVSFAYAFMGSRALARGLIFEYGRT